MVSEWKKQRGSVSDKIIIGLNNRILKKSEKVKTQKVREVEKK